ncbi:MULTISPECIES: hypothetical protein [unclassified Serratia (in: enterobacteria)]|uniref:hypothetical protein n=1 Tax=unclassified Serratia (in: enterobacteria) TaxID=2647522 RepID=UPI003075F38E
MTEIDITGSILSFDIKEGFLSFPFIYEGGGTPEKSKASPVLHPMNKAKSKIVILTIALNEQISRYKKVSALLPVEDSHIKIRKFYRLLTRHFPLPCLRKNYCKHL